MGRSAAFHGVRAYINKPDSGLVPIFIQNIQGAVRLRMLNDFPDSLEDLLVPLPRHMPSTWFHAPHMY